MKKIILILILLIGASYLFISSDTTDLSEKQINFEENNSQPSSMKINHSSETKDYTKSFIYSSQGDQISIESNQFINNSVIRYNIDGNGSVLSAGSELLYESSETDFIKISNYAQIHYKNHPYESTINNVDVESEEIEWIINLIEYSENKTVEEVTEVTADVTSEVREINDKEATVVITNYTIILQGLFSDQSEFTTELEVNYDTDENQTEIDLTKYEQLDEDEQREYLEEYIKEYDLDKTVDELEEEIAD